MFEHFGADVSYATRLLARSPAFTIACVVALGLAIGANVTVFTLANAFLSPRGICDHWPASRADARQIYLTTKLNGTEVPADSEIRRV